MEKPEIKFRDPVKKVQEALGLSDQGFANFKVDPTGDEASFPN
jgi:hypothetical protein